MTRLSVQTLCVVAAAWISTATATGAVQVPTTLEDFFIPGTQPETLVDPIKSAVTECRPCHGDFDGNLPPYDRWKASAMAQAMRDPLFHACLAVANQDVAGVGDLCLRCHSPGGWLEGRSTPTSGAALTGADFEGVTCSVCHRLVDPVMGPANPVPDDAILNDLTMELTCDGRGTGDFCDLIDDCVGGIMGGTNCIVPQACIDAGGVCVPECGGAPCLASPNQIPGNPHTGSFVVDPLDRRRGPFELEPGFGFHLFEVSPFHQESLLCANCHDVSNPVFERVGGPVPAPTDTFVLGTLDEAHLNLFKYDMFPLERTYSEWSQSIFAQGPVDMGGRFGGDNPLVSSCQDCHMPDVSGIACVFNDPSQPRPDLPSHDFLGAANWMLDAVLNLDVTGDLYDPATEGSGLFQFEVDEAKARNQAFLQAASDLDVSAVGGFLRVRVTNQTGHKLPTGYPEGRRMWLNVRFLDDQGLPILEHGAYDTETADLTTGDTKVYEALQGVDATVAAAAGIPVGQSFHFALNNLYVKDNRIPPMGFTNAGFASVQAAPVAHVYADGQNFDDTDFLAPCNAASVEVSLFYQTSSKEYIEFLRDENVTNNAGQVLFDQWVATGRGAPLLMNSATMAFGDCNVNGVFDACDIAGPTSLDVNANDIPDECETPAAVALGGRYISVTPQSLGVPVQVALVVTSPAYPCLEKYITPAATLADAPVFQTIAQWGTVVLSDALIVPESVYHVQVEFQGGARSGVAPLETWVYGDANQDDFPNFADIFLGVNGFQGVFKVASLEALDISPCAPDQVVNFSDIFAFVLAFQFNSFVDVGCSLPCP